MRCKELKGEEKVLKYLELANLSEEDVKCSKSLKYQRDAVYYFYYKEMDIEECCSKMDFITRKTFDKYMVKALLKINKYIE
ncbi:MAG: hypothetical protein RR478_05160 [Bacilli bacterium]